MTKYHVYLMITIVLAVVGQLSLKAGAGRGGGIFEQLLHTQTIAALAAYFFSAICYMYALREIPVSIAFPSVSISTVVIVAIAAHLFWKEPFGVQQLVAVALIGVGIFLLFRG
jgi:small multidrug resistance pump